MIPEKIYTGKVKLLEHTEFSYTHENLEEVLAVLAEWREYDSNKFVDYDLFITDQYGITVFGARF